MKKILLASTVVLSMAGISKTTVLAKENQATNKVQSSEKTVANGTSKEAKEKKQAQGQEQNDKQNQNETQIKAEKDSSQSEQKQETAVTKDNSSTEEITEEVNKEGWQKENGQWRYYENKKAVTNWKKIAGHWYYFNQDGIMLSNTVYDDYLFNKSGAMVETSWVKIDEKWYYATESGKIIRNKWEKINGSWYRFDETGIMLSKTIYNDYLLQTSGAMAEKDWVKMDEKWYYATESGKIIRNKWDKINGSWYRFDETGIMLSKTIYNDYLLQTSGAMAEKNWVKMDEKWYYATDSGKVVRNKWEKINSSWYLFDKDGVMLSSQWKDKYYLKDSGAMAKNEWFFDKKYNSWFYLKSDGSYAENQWQGSYYLKSYGYMAKNEWIFDKYYNSWYYLKENGQYVTNIYKISGKDHIFKNDGRWVSEVPEGFVKGQYSRTIFLDPGHGGRDSGAYYYNVAEKDLNMQVYRKLRKKLEELGYKVLTSRDSDIDVDFVTERSRMVNKTNSDIFISIHFNATGSPYSRASGIQTYSYSDDPDYPSKINPYWHNHPDRMSESKRLAAAIHSSLLAETGAKDAGLLERSFAVLRETAKPAVLLELGYIDNFAENQQIRDSHYQDKLVAGIVKGIQKYYAGK